MLQHRRSGSEQDSAASPPETILADVVTAVPALRLSPRARLLGAMIDVVALRGYDRATVSRVVSCAGLEEAVFSEHFRDKHDCFTQAVDELFCEAERFALECAQRPMAWPERVRMALESVLTELAAHPSRARVLLVEVLGAGAEACERHRAAMALFTSLLEQGRKQLANTDHLPEQTSEAIVGGIAAILQRRVFSEEIADLPTLHSDLTYFALLPYLDHESALAVAGTREPLGG